MSTVRATFDTNSLVSLFVVTSSLAKELRDLWLAGAYELAVSPSILEEFKRVARYPRIRKQFAFTDEEIDQFVDALRAGAVLTEDRIDVDVVAEDPDDNKVLACAVEATVAYVVTRDHHLKNIGEYQGIKIIDPEAFHRLLRETSH